MSPFQLALQRGLESSEKTSPVNEALQALGPDFKITSAEDAQVLADALISAVDQNPDLSKRLTPFANLRQLLDRVGSKEAFGILQARALPALERLFDINFNVANPNGRDLSRLLNTFGAFARPEGFERIARAIRTNLDCGWFWTAIFRSFDTRHPFLKDLLAIPMADFPKGFVRVAFLDHANKLAIAGQITHHPFDSYEGKAQLREYLTSSDPEVFSYATSAAASLPFISAPERTELLALAMDHMHALTQLEGAWAAAKVGNQGGLAFLSRACADPATFVRAAAYLKELGHTDLVPEKCYDADFIAESQARSWLVHPNEFGSQPDEMSLLDTRIIYWLPANEDRHVHLFRYRYAAKGDATDQKGVVMTGGLSTFSLFSENSTEMSPEDIYAIHCCWELEMNKDPRAPKKRSPEAGRALLGFPPK